MERRLDQVIIEKDIWFWLEIKMKGKKEKEGKQ